MAANFLKGMTKINKHMKMSELVETNYHLLSILSRLGVDESFSGRTVEDQCARYGLDADTFVLICSVYTYADYKPTEEELRNANIADILRYLHSSHNYYINSALKRLSPSIEQIVAPTSQVQQKVIRRFFDNYKSELNKHFAYEEEIVIPYVHELLSGHKEGNFSMAIFKENHSNIDESLSDLKNLIMNSLPKECNGALRIEVLSNLFHLQEDLDHHTYIEDCILVPLVEILEGRDPSPAFVAAPTNENDASNTLSDREKEVLVEVAHGYLNKEIADRLNISINTVITHRKNITRKTGIKTTPGLTVYAILNGLVDINTIE